MERGRATALLCRGYLVVEYYPFQFRGCLPSLAGVLAARLCRTKTRWGTEVRPGFGAAMVPWWRGHRRFPRGLRRCCCDSTIATPGSALALAFVTFASLSPLPLVRSGSLPFLISFILYSFPIVFLHISMIERHKTGDQFLFLVSPGTK